jgi:hypothetical protein
MTIADMGLMALIWIGLCWMAGICVVGTYRLRRMKLAGKELMSKALREVEEKIVGAFVDAALAKGYRLSVSLEGGFDHDEMLLGSKSRDDIMKAAFSGDDCHIFVNPAEGDLIDSSDNTINSIGWVFCVLGNSGWDVISDYSVGLEKLGLMVEAQKISDHYSE